MAPKTLLKDYRYSMLEYVIGRRIVRPKSAISTALSAPPVQKNTCAAPSKSTGNVQPKENDKSNRHGSSNEQDYSKQVRWNEKELKAIERDSVSEKRRRKESEEIYSEGGVKINKRPPQEHASECPDCNIEKFGVPIICDTCIRKQKPNPTKNKQRKKGNQGESQNSGNMASKKNDWWDGKKPAWAADSPSNSQQNNDGSGNNWGNNNATTWEPNNNGNNNSNDWGASTNWNSNSNGNNWGDNQESNNATNWGSNTNENNSGWNNNQNSGTSPGWSDNSNTQGDTNCSWNNQDSNSSKHTGNNSNWSTNTQTPNQNGNGAWGDSQGTNWQQNGANGANNEDKTWGNGQNENTGGINQGNAQNSGQNGGNWGSTQGNGQSSGNFGSNTQGNWGNNQGFSQRNNNQSHGETDNLPPKPAANNGQNSGFWRNSFHSPQNDSNNGAWIFIPNVQPGHNTGVFNSVENSNGGNPNNGQWSQQSCPSGPAGLIWVPNPPPQYQAATSQQTGSITSRGSIWAPIYSQSNQQNINQGSVPRPLGGWTLVSNVPSDSVNQDRVEHQSGNNAHHGCQACGTNQGYPSIHSNLHQHEAQANNLGSSFGYTHSQNSSNQQHAAFCSLNQATVPQSSSQKQPYTPSATTQNVDPHLTSPFVQGCPCASCGIYLRAKYIESQFPQTNTVNAAKTDSCNNRSCLARHHPQQPLTFNENCHHISCGCKDAHKPSCEHTCINSIACKLCGIQNCNRGCSTQTNALHTSSPCPQGQSSHQSPPNTNNSGPHASSSNNPPNPQVVLHLDVNGSSPAYPNAHFDEKTGNLTVFNPSQRYTVPVNTTFNSGWQQTPGTNLPRTYKSAEPDSRGGLGGGPDGVIGGAGTGGRRNGW